MRSGERVGPYELVDRLGEGGMGVVWEAVDTRLGRSVALKFLPEGVADDPETRARFEREARAVSALSHPNVCVLYDIGEHEGRPYLVMELLRGKPLDVEIEAGPLPEAELWRMALHLARGLDAAHRVEILHRDLKPANVFRLESGDTKILDFGVARVAAADGDDATELTAAGTLLGTVKYMSPEQALGRPLDGRSDLFSLGALLYEAATGEPPFQEPSVGATLNAVVHEPVTLARRQGTSPTFAALVDRLLAKEPAQRFATAAHLAEALERGIASFTGSGASRLSGAVDAGATPGAGPSIAVLPFENFSADPDSEYFSDGLAEELTTGLSRVKGLRVAARSSAFRLKGEDLDACEAGRRLGVSSVLEGSVRRAGNRVRVSVQLVDVDSGFQSWSDRFDGTLDDIFQIQEDTASAIIEQLQVRLGGSGESPVLRQHTTSPEAYEMYLRGRFHWERRHRGEQAKALQCFKNAVAIDPEYALAHVGIADVHWSNLAYGAGSPQDLVPAARRAIERARQLAPDLPETLASEAVITTFVGDWRAAEPLYEAAMKAAPTYWLPFAYAAMQDGLLLRRGSVARRSSRALELEPESAFCWSIAGLAYYFAEDYEAALEHALRALELDPGAALTRLVLGLAYCDTQRYPQAIEHLEAGVRLANRLPAFLAPFAHALGVSGDRAGCRRILEELERRADEEYVMPIHLGLAYLGVGERERAHELYREAVVGQGVTPLWPCMVRRPFPDILAHWDLPLPERYRNGDA